MKSYEEIPFIIPVMAETVCERPYTGEEFSFQSAPDKVKRIDDLRRAMTSEQRQDFAMRVDGLCRAAFAVRAKWFMGCIRSKSNRGRDQMLDVWIPHWLSSYLQGGSFKKRFF